MTAPAQGAAAILVGAGSGDRLGDDRPKAFVELAGVPMLVRAARALVDSGSVTGLVVVVGAGEEDRARKVLTEDGVRPRAVCAGGSTRQQSVACGLAVLEGPEAIVAVHDAARPLASPELVARVVAAIRPPVVAAAPGLPVVDTLKRCEPGQGRVVRTVDRADLWAVQTPQVFDRATLERVHAEAGAGATDDLALVEAAGLAVVLVPGERRNFKITYPEDLAIAEVLAGGADV